MKYFTRVCGVVVKFNVGHVFGAVPHALALQSAHVQLQADKSEHREHERGQNDHIAQTNHRLYERVDNCLQARHNCHRLESPQNAESSQHRQISE